MFKLNAIASDPILLERCIRFALNLVVRADFMQRANGHEKQYRFQCPRCSLVIGYQSSPPPVKSASFLYIVKGALTQMQGQVPPDAFEGEHEL